MTRTHLALATLAALGLAAQPQAARAQSLTLNSGDAVTVSGAGTVGKIGATTYLPGQNTTTSYDDSTSGNYAARTNGTSAFTLGVGGTLSGATNYSTGLYAKGSGPVTVSGGTVSGGYAGTGLAAYGSGQVTVSGGAVSAGDNGTGLAAYGSGPVTVSGGTLTAGKYGTGLFANGSGPVTVTGGAISSGDYGDGLNADGRGIVTVTGGAISGGSYGLYANGGGTINLFSQGDTPFLINGISMNNTSLAPYQYTSGADTISGTLFDGETLDTTFYDQGGTINLNVGTPPSAPDPSQTAALALGALGLSALALRARRRPAA